MVKPREVPGPFMAGYSVFLMAGTDVSMTDLNDDYTVTPISQFKRGGLTESLGWQWDHAG